MDHVAVLVIGAGPTGATAAIMLGRRGVRTLVLDRRPDVYPLPRAVHLDDEVFRVFAGMGLADEVRTLSRPAPGMRLTDARQRVLLDLRREPLGRHGFPQANMFDQPELEKVLRRALAEQPDVTFRGGAAVCEIAEVAGGPGPVRVRYRDTGAETGAGAGPVREVWADAVLGCDGANGITREAIGARMQDLGFTQRWLVVDVTAERPLPVYDGVQQVCDNARAATFMPVTGNRYRWEFRLAEGEEPDESDRAALLLRLAPWLTGVDPASLTVVRQTCYTFRGAVADRWRAGRVLLLGDAAHQTPPFIGQGMCAGIRDAANLVWKLALVLDGAADDRLLDTYEAERRPAARRFVRLAIAVGSMMTGGPAPLARPRNAALRAAGLVLGPGLRIGTLLPVFDDGPLVHGPARRRRRTGDLFGRPSIGGTPLDDLVGDGWAVVYRGPDRVAAFDPPTRGWFAALGAVVVRVGPGDQDAGALLDRHRADAVLLRPDRVIAAAADTPDLRAWRRRLVAAGITPRMMPS